MIGKPVDCASKPTCGKLSYLDGNANKSAAQNISAICTFSFDFSHPIYFVFEIFLKSVGLLSPKITNSKLPLFTFNDLDSKSHPFL